MKLLTALATGLAICYTFCVILRADAHRRQLTRYFRCWLCKQSTLYMASDKTRHCDCGYCGIGNKLMPGALVGELPDIQVTLV